jgi:hypothetical protein
MSRSLSFPRSAENAEIISASKRSASLAQESANTEMMNRRKTKPPPR